jgi:hypothetical protein
MSSNHSHKKTMALLLAAALGLCLTGCGDDPAQGNLGTLDPIPTVEETPPVSSSCKPDAGEPLRCKPVFTTKMLVLNGILPGTSVEEVMEVSNTGTGPCDFKEWELIPCSMTGTGYHCDGNHFSGFEIVSAPPVGGRLRPGESTAFELVFKAPDEVGLSVVKTHHLARLTPWFSDPCDEGALRAPPWEGTNGVNLRAIVEGSFATITPPFLDFGVVGTTCPVQTRALVVRNAGPTSFKVTKLTLKGCNDIVSPTPGHTLPLSVAGFGEATLAFDYVSKGEITTDCKLVIETTALNMPSSTIPVWGRGVLPGLRTEYFTAHAPQKLDALFVVDNSNSMTDKQAILTEELPKLALQVMNAGQDVHLAVTTTDAVATEGAFIGTPAFVTSGDDVEAYANTVKVGTQGALNEKGFLSAWLALTGPNSTDDGVNAGFLRPDANLAVVFISDEDDHSPDSVEMWIERFVGLKKSWRGSGVAIHSVVATHDPCGEVSAIGTRYVTLANAFAGQISDICSGAFAEALTATGLAALSASERYYLTAPPKPHSVEIHVNDELCSDGWTWNPKIQAVVFAMDSPCFPQNGAQVEIRYEVACP